MKPTRTPIPGPQQQRAAATLVVVMTLFLIMAMLAAYANRGLLYEQRMANSHYRAGLSQEMAEAAIEWSVAMLNGPATDAQCRPVATGGTRFADRYLTIDAGDRGIRPNAPATNTQPGIVADCMRAQSGWSCRCPSPGRRTLPAAVPGTDLVPSFGIGIQAITDRGGTVQIAARGCTTSVVDDCVGAAQDPGAYLGLSQQSALLALVSAVRSPPAAPLVVKGNLDAMGAGLGLHNTDPRSAGLLVDAGGALNGLRDNRLDSVPGTLPSLARIAGDTTLTAAQADVFKMFMGATAARYKLHPALRVVTCSGDCTGTLESAYVAGLRILWVEGPLTISSNKALGDPADPVVVIASGDITLSGPFQLSGMLVSRGNLSWTNTGGLPSLINGSVLVEGNVRTDGGMDIHYQPSIADQLRNRMGSYVRVPGGWTDNDPQ